MMYVIAAKGTQCPKEGQPRKYITDTAPCEVPETAYYTRLIADGSLIRTTVGADGNLPETKKEKK